MLLDGDRLVWHEWRVDLLVKCFELLFNFRLDFQPLALRVFILTLVNELVLLEGEGSAKGLVADVTLECLHFSVRLLVRF